MQKVRRDQDILPECNKRPFLSKEAVNIVIKIEKKVNICKPYYHKRCGFWHMTSH